MRTVDGVQSGLLILRIQVPKRLAHHQTQFYLVVQRGAAGAQDGALVGTEDGGRRLQEEEGLLGLGVVQFGDVVAAFRLAFCVPRG